MVFLNGAIHNLIHFKKIKCCLVGIHFGGLTLLLASNMNAYSWPTLVLPGWYWNILCLLVSKQRKTLSAFNCMAFAIL